MIMRGLKRAILIFTCLLACSAYFGTGVLNARLLNNRKGVASSRTPKAGERGLKGTS
jgi:hypothetical protein